MCDKSYFLLVLSAPETKVPSSEKKSNLAVFKFILYNSSVLY